MPSQNDHSSPFVDSSFGHSVRASGELLRRIVDAPDADDPCPASGDIVDDLLNVAWVNQYQLAVLAPLVGAVQPIESTVVAVIELANHIGSADAASVGAAATLVSVTRDGDEYSVAECLSRVLSCFSEDELRSAAAALTTALTLTIADVLHVEPTAAWDEMLDTIATSASDTPARPLSLA